MKKLSAKWVPRLLIVDKNRACDIFRGRFAAISAASTGYSRGPRGILYYSSDTKDQFQQYVASDESALKTSKTVRSPELVMATVFWGKLFKGAHYASLWGYSGKENVPDWPTNKTVTITSTHPLMPVQKWSQNWWSWGTNLFDIPPSRNSWHPRTIITCYTNIKKIG